MCERDRERECVCGWVAGWLGGACVKERESERVSVHTVEHLLLCGSHL